MGDALVRLSEILSICNILIIYDKEFKYHDIKNEPGLCENQLLYGDENYDEGSDEEIIVMIRKRYTVRPRPDLFNEYDNIEFVKRFRFRKCTVQKILTLKKQD